MRCRLCRRLFVPADSRQIYCKPSHKVMASQRRTRARQAAKIAALRAAVTDPDPWARAIQARHCRDAPAVWSAIDAILAP